MEGIEYWKERWTKGQIKYHLQQAHPSIKENISKLLPNLQRGSGKILVPFCGKSLDMIYLMNQGFHVVGIEVSEVAVNAFFTENNLSFQTEVIGEFTRYKHNEHLVIYCGDYFQITAKLIGGVCDNHWDRGGLVALEECNQQKYVDQLKSLLSDTSCTLLESFEYNVSHSGPPRPIFLPQLQSLFGDEFILEEVSRVYSLDMPEYVNRYKDFYHVLYFIKRVSNK